MAPKRYAIVGTGHRASNMFGRPLCQDFPETAELVALYDNNSLRLAAFAAALPREIPTFADFETMMKQADPDGVVVTTRDCFHADYVIAALEAGKRAISEKPLCTTAAQCRAILAAAEQSSATCMVTHNARYGAAGSLIHEIIQSGRLGKPQFVQFDETLDRCHGADYFRRWHRQKANSGGLLIHKASHHFDCLNWWIGSTPVEVSAQGRLCFYGANGQFRGRRCSDCPHADTCEFHADIFNHEEYRRLYLEAESEDGYLRDSCVFDPEIDVEDQAAVLIRYEDGVQVSYTLVAYSPYESQRVIIECERGRLEYSGLSNTGWVQDGRPLPGIEELAGEELKVYMPGKGIENVPVERVRGGHGGADPQLRADFFGQDFDAALNERMASLDEAVQAVLIGAAANQSIATGKPVDVQSLLKAGPAGV